MYRPIFKGNFFSVCNFYFHIWHFFKSLINNTVVCLHSIRACATFNKGNKLLFSLFFSNSMHSHWLLQGHMTLKNKNVLAKSLSGQYCQVCRLRYYLRILTTFSDILSLACITGALWAKGGKRGILREVQNECEAQDKGRRKKWKNKKNPPPLVSRIALVFAFTSLGSWSLLCRLYVHKVVH